MEWYLRALVKYAVFRGRARRKEYWLFTLFNFTFAMILLLVDVATDNFDKETRVGLFSTLYGTAVFLPGMSVFVRRLHDIGRSGWWLLIALVPILGALLLLAFLVQDSDPGPNRFGPNPKRTRVVPA